MNFMNNPNGGMIPPIMNNPNMINNILYKLNEYENRIKNLEQKVNRLENNSNNSYTDYNNEPDNNMYMI